MKKRSFILIAFFSFLICAPMFAAEKPKEKPAPRPRTNEKIAVSRLGGTTRSTSYEVDAYFQNNNLVSIDINNFMGSAKVTIFTGRGSIQRIFDINNFETMEIDLSSYRAGTYTIRIVLDGETYGGTFTKNLYGR